MSLRQKLLVPQLLIAAAIIAYIYGIWMPLTLADAERSRLSLVERHLDTVAAGLVPLLLGEQLDIIHENLGALIDKNADWTSVHLFNAEGKQLYPLNNAAIPRPQPPEMQRRSVGREVAYSDMLLGRLAVDIDIGPALSRDRQQNAHLARLILGLLGAMLAVTMLTLELAVRRPLGLVASASTALARQDFSAPLPRAGKDEVGALVSSFAAMRDGLNAFHAKVLQEVTERCQAEEALRERETIYSSLVAAMAEGVVFRDAAGVVTAVNPAAERILAGSAIEAKAAASEGHSLPYLHEDGSAFPSENHPSAISLRTGEPQNDVVMGLSKQDGTVTWISANSQPLIRDGEKTPYAAVSTFRDITAIKQAEEDRRAHLRFFENLDRVNRAIQGATSLDQMMSDVLDVVLDILECDRAWLLYPCDPEAPTWQAPMERTRSEYPSLLPKGVDIPISDVLVWNFRTVLHLDGPVVIGPESEYPLPEDAAERFGFKSFIGIALYPKTGNAWEFGLHQCSHARVWTPEDKRLFQEVARRMADGLSSLLSQRNIRENEHKYREIFDNVSDSLMLFDVTGDSRFRFADMNPFAEKISGVAKTAAMGQLFEDVVQPGQIEHTLALFRQCVETGEPISYEEHIESGAAPRDLNTVLLPVRNDVGSVYRLIEFNRDVTRIKTAERQFRTLVENLPDYVSRLDADARFIYVSPTVTAAFGAPLEWFMGKTVHDAFPALGEDAKQLMDESVRQVFASGTGSSCEIQLPMPAGARTMEIRYIPELDRNGKVTSVLSISRDITERIRMTDSLRQLSAAVEQSPVSVFITDAGGTILYVNPGFCANTGYTAEEVLGKHPRILSGEGTSPEEYAALWNTVKAGNSWHGTFRNKRKDGTRQWVEAIIAPIREANGAITQFVSIEQDITARKKAEERVEFLAHHDALTGLPNRLLGRDRMEMAMMFAERHGCKAVLIFLDLDGFKRVNDSLGHDGGDALLAAVAARLQPCIRKTDTIARQGGDEFLIMLAEVRDPAVITAIAATILECLARPFVINGHELSLSGSLGIAIYPDDGRDWNTLFKNADIAMYSAKEAGRNTYRFFTEQMNTDADENLRLRNKLQNALERGEFILHYQPQIDLRSARVVGVEALLRWNNPELGAVSPDRFIPLAEDSGLIVPIGDWVLREACQQAAAWRKAGMPHLVMAVNLSAVQFRSGQVLASVRQALAESGLEPSYLELEMTESILIKDTDNVLATVNQLKALGVTLSIDDFGTGFSALSYLTRFNADKVKIDQSFVRDITTDANSAAVVTAIVQMAHSLGMTTIAEGVNDGYTLEVLRQRGCDEVQGYYLARPMPAGEIGAFLRDFGQLHDRSGSGIYGIR